MPRRIHRRLSVLFVFIFIASVLLPLRTQSVAAVSLPQPEIELSTPVVHPSNARTDDTSAIARQEPQWSFVPKTVTTRPDPIALDLHISPTTLAATSTMASENGMAPTDIFDGQFESGDRTVFYQNAGLNVSDIGGSGEPGFPNIIGSSSIPAGRHTSLDLTFMTTVEDNWLSYIDIEMKRSSAAWSTTSYPPYRWHVPSNGRHHLTIPASFPATEGVDLRFFCSTGTSAVPTGGRCTFSNLVVYDDTPHWSHNTYPVDLPWVEIDGNHLSVDSIKITHQPVSDLVPDTGAYLAFDLKQNEAHYYASEAFGLPPLIATDVLTASVRWTMHFNAGETIDSQGDGANSVSMVLLSMPVGAPSEAEPVVHGLAYITPFHAVEPWQTSTQGYFEPLGTTKAAEMTGALSQVVLKVPMGNYKPHRVGIDDIQLFLNGTLLAPIQPPDRNIPPEQCPCQPTNVGGPIDTRTGQSWTTATDLMVPGPGPALVWDRAYVTRNTGLISGTLATLGVGWQHGYGDRVFTDPTEPNVVSILTPKGNRFRYLTKGNGTFESFPGIFNTLVQANGVYTQTFRTHEQHVFNATSGQLTDIYDSTGGHLHLTYTAGRLTRIADTVAMHRSLDLTYTNNRITSVQDGVGRQVQYTYTATSNDLFQVFDVGQRPTTYWYQNHLLTGIDNALGQPIERTAYDLYTPAGKAISQTLLDGRRLNLSYTATTMVTTTAPTGEQDVETYSFGARSTLIQRSVNGVVVQQEGTDRNFAPSTRTDARGNQSHTTYTPKGQPLVIENALGQRTTLAYDTRSNPIRITDTLGRNSLYRYDQYNQIISQTTTITTSLPLGITTLYTYSTQFPHQQIAEYLPTGILNTMELDTTGQVVTTTMGANTPTPQISVVAYDPLIRGRVLRVTQAVGTSDATTTQFDYDALGRVVTTTLDLGTVIQRLDVTRYNVDDSIRATIVNYQNGIYAAAAPDIDIITTYGYDALGRQVWVRDPLGHYHVTHYDVPGRVDWTLTNLWPVTLDGQGAPILPTTPPAYSGTRPDSNITTLTGYDGLGRTNLVTQTGILTGAITLASGLPVFTETSVRVTRTAYDSLSRPITITQNYRPTINGGVFTPAYPDVNVQTVTRYDTDGNVIGERDALGRWTVTDYDALNRPVIVTLNYENGNPLTVDPGHTGWPDLANTDLVSVSAYGPDGRLERTIENHVNGVFTATEPITDRITLYQYDFQGRVVTTTLNYDPATLTTRTDTNLSTATAFDPTTGRMVGGQDAAGRWMHQDYDVFGRVTRTIANCRTAAGVPSATACAPFNPQGRLDRNVPTLSRYDALGRIVETEDAQGHIQRTTTNRLSRTTTMIQNYVPNTTPTTTTNVISLQTVDALGRTVITTDTVVTTTIVDYRETRSVYDALGRTQATVTPLGTTTYASNALGQTVVMTDTAGRVTKFGYDGTGVLRWQRRHDGELTIAAVDGLGRVTTTIQNYQNGVVDSGESADRDILMPTRYDAAGRQVLTTDAGRHATTFAYNLLDQLIAVTENATTGACVYAPCNVVTQYQYDRMGNRTAIIDALTHIRRATYDAAGRQLTATDAANVTTAWTYDRLGRKTLQDDPRGPSYDLQFAYDERDRITQTLALNLTTPVQAQYDALGRRTQLQDASGTTTFAYNPLGYLTDVGRTDGTVRYAYTSRGDRTQLRYPDGANALYGYDGAGRLAQVGDGTTTLATYAYDAVGRLESLSRANGATTTYGYDPADRTVQQTTTRSGTLLSDFAYTLNAAGQRTSVTETLPLVGQNRPSAVPLMGPVRESVAAPTTAWLPLLRQGNTTLSSGAPTTTDPAAAAPRTVLGPAIPSSQPAGAARAAQSAATAALSFVPNQGQTANGVQFHSQSPAGTIFFAGTEIVLALPTPRTPSHDRTSSLPAQAAASSSGNTPTTAVHMQFRNALADATVRGMDVQPGVVHYLTGKNKAQWHQNIPTYAGVRYEALYPKIAAVFTGTSGVLKSTYIVSPTGNPALIRWQYAEASTVVIDAAGELVITIAADRPTQSQAPLVMRESAPVAWQVIGGQQVPVSIAYTVTATTEIGFVVGTYNANYPLIIDPSLTYSTYLGGGAADYATALTVDAAGNIYMAGSTASLDFPDLGTITGTRGTGMDAFVGKLSATGDSYLFYLGGSGSDYANGIAFDSSGNAYVIGTTDSTNFPMVNARQSTRAGTSGSDVFITKINPTGTALLYSTYHGGSGNDTGRGIAVDSSGNAYLTGSTDSSTFPVQSPRQACPSGNTDAFMTKLNSTGQTLVYSTCVGGSSTEGGYGIAVDSTGIAAMVGTTTSTNYPTTVGAHRTANTGSDTDTVVTKLNASGSAWVYSTYLGGDGNEEGWGIVLDAASAAYVVGETASSNFPTVVNARQSTLSGTRDGYLTKLNATGTALTYSTYHGGSGADSVYAVVLDSSTNAYVTGSTTSSNFPTQTPYQAVNGGGEDAFITKFNPTASALVYSTYLGGTGDDSGRGIGQINGVASVQLSTTSPNLPIVGSNFYPTGGGTTLFHASLSTAGTTLTSSGYLGGGGRDSGRGIAVDSTGNAYITGETFTANFPTLMPVQSTDAGNYDAFVTKVNASGALVYSTYLGGSGTDRGYAIAVTSSGSAVLVGSTQSTNFPLTTARQTTSGGGTDGFVTMLNSTGTGLVYSTYHGGSGSDTAYGVALDSSGNAYVTGSTDSTNFPVSASRYQGTRAGSSDAFVTKFSGTGTLNYGTYLGGIGYDVASAIAVDSSGNAYVTGDTASSAFPQLNARQSVYGGATDAFVTKLNTTGTALVYSTYHGGAGQDTAKGIAVDSSGKATIAGYTVSTTAMTPPFPLMNALQASYGGSGDAFVSQFAATGQSLTYSTYLGGAGGEWAAALAVDSGGNAYITGYTASTTTMSPPFPITNAIQATYGGGSKDLFVSVINAAGSGLLASTYLGGSLDDSGTSIVVDGKGAHYVTGSTYSQNFPTTGGALQSASHGYDAVVVKLAEVVPPTVPMNISVVRKTDTALALSWTVSTDNVAIAGYDLYQGTTLVGSSVRADLVLANRTANTSYALTIKARDPAGNTSAASTVVNTTTTASFVGAATGHLLTEWWLGIAGTSVSQLTSDARYPNNADKSMLLTSFEAPSNWEDNYGTRLRGYLHPTVSGSYTFWIASDETSELWLSPDGNPTTKTKIASVPSWTSVREWTKYPQQQSVTITLEAGQKYYLEALHKEATGGEHLAVAWLPPGGTQAVIPGSALSAFTTAPDLQVPSAPINLHTTTTNYTSLALAWSAASDNVAVSSYLVYQGATLVGVTTNPSYAVSNLNPDTSYTFVVKARDASGNISASSTVLTSATAIITEKVTTYTYDGLGRLQQAQESPGNAYAYDYDLVGNRTGVWMNTTRTETRTYTAADQVVGWSYDAAGNLTNDGTQTYTYNALNHLTGTTPQSGASTSYLYNGDGVLVNQTTGGVLTRFTQDLQAPVSQMLQVQVGSTTTRYVYGYEQVATITGSTRTWPLHDALGSVRRTLDDAGLPLTTSAFDPWGQPAGGAQPSPFGFTGEYQNQGLVYLRARWYQPGNGRFTGRDPFDGWAETPYSLHPYQYGYSDPIKNTDPTGMWMCTSEDQPRGVGRYQDYRAYCSLQKARLDSDAAFTTKRTDNALGAFIDLFGGEILPGGSDIPRDIQNVFGYFPSARQRFEFVSWYISDEPDNDLSTKLGRVPFTDTGFSLEFQDHHYDKKDSNQVHHFMGAAILGYLSYMPQWEAFTIIIGHEKNPDSRGQFIPGFGATALERDLFRMAINLDIAGEEYARDCVLKIILPEPVEKAVGDPTALPQGGRSMQDLRLSLKAYRFGLGINEGEIHDLASARSWLGINLRSRIRR